MSAPPKLVRDPAELSEVSIELLLCENDLLNDFLRIEGNLLVLSECL